MSNSSNMQIMVKADVLGAPVDGVYVTKETEENLKLGTDENTTRCSLKVQTMLVYGSPEDPTRMSIMELVNKLGTLFTGGFVKQKTIENALPEKLMDALDKIKFSINVIYFTKVSSGLSTKIEGKQGELTADSKKKNDGSYEKPDSAAAQLLTANSKDSQYAVWVNVHVDPDLMKDLPISVSELSFKVWSTDNAKVLNEMEITKVNEMLKGAGIALPAPEAN